MKALMPDADIKTKKHSSEVEQFDNYDLSNVRRFDSCCFDERWREAGELPATVIKERGMSQDKESAKQVQETADKDDYLETINRLEPEIAAIDPGAYYASAAISLKRIADALEEHNAILKDHYLL